MRTITATIPPTVSPLSDLAPADRRARRLLPRVRQVTGVTAIDADRQRSLQSELDLAEGAQTLPEPDSGRLSDRESAALLAEIDAASPDALRLAHEGGGVFRVHHYHVDESA